MKNLIFLLTVVRFFSGYSAERGYGDWPKDYPFHPIMRERQILVLTNACRISPTQYRDKYVGNYTILLPANYPAVNPIYWILELSRSAKAHTKDMADVCGLQHESSNGTAWDARIKSYYKKSGWIAENIATGNADAFNTMKQWILDGNPPAADKSGNDGHRENIMSTNFKEIGAGYAYGTKQWYHFWVQDFGGGTPVYKTPILAGAHFVLPGGKTLFAANYSDPAGIKPKEAKVVIDNVEHTLSLSYGQ